MAAAYYNEIDPYCADWLRNLIAAGEIPAGEVDERSIEEVTADDVRPYTQCHFFAGIGGWAFATRLAGWRDTDPLWTASCPCQPYSSAGKRLADRDPRNLWPHFARLIAECRPAGVAGEQVTSPAGRLWIAGVRADMEALGYAVGAADLCAAGISAPHPRQRLWWVADAERTRVQGEAGDNKSSSREVSAEARQQRIRPDAGPNGGDRGRGGIRMGYAQQQGLEGHAGHDADGYEPGWIPTGTDGSVAEAGGHSWGDHWIPCADGKRRRIEPGTAPLVARLPGHVEQVRAYGNSIVPQEAAEVLMAWREATA